MTGPDGERLCGSCGEPNPVRAKFCLECGTKFPVADAAPEKPDLIDQLPQEAGAHGERRTVSVLFADLSGFTAYSEGTDVEDIRALANETADRLGEIVQKYGGYVDKIIGDCVMAVFGAPVAHEDDAERSVRAALDMQDCVAENRERFAGLNLCVGIQTGEAMWAPVGPGGQFTVLGDTVNTAARLQGAAGKGEVVIGLPTFEAVAESIECEELEPIKAKNKAEPVPAWRAVSVTGARKAHRAVLASFVGRDNEINRLREVWENVRASRRPFGVTVLGAAGVGKSRLVQELVDEIGDEAFVVRGRCLPYGEGITYWPVIEIIQQVAEITHDDDTATVSRKLGALLEGLGSDDLDELRTMAVALANVVGAPTTPRGTYTATEISKGELHWGLRRIIELGAKDFPLILVLDDLHWAEPTLLDLISFICESTSDASILVFCTGRPEVKDIGTQLTERRANRRILEVDAIADDAARSIVDELVGVEDLPARLVDDLLHSAGGNPLFLEEIAQMLRDAARTSHGGVISVDDLAVPKGMRSLIDSRLDKIPAAARRVAAHAAVVGDVFWDGAIEHLESNGHDLDAMLDILEERDIIRSHAESTVGGHREFAFKHGVFRDAAYARLAKTDRAPLHERFASWLSGMPGAGMEFAEIVAYHLEQSCRVASELSMTSFRPPIIPAAHALMNASERAEKREGMREAEGFIARAVELLGSALPETRVELNERRGRLLAGLGRYDESCDLLRSVAAHADELDRPDLRCRALVGIAEVRVPLGGVAEGRECVDEAERIARELGDPLLRVRALWSRAAIQDMFEGDAMGAEESLRTSIALADEARDPSTMLQSRMRLGAIFFNAADLVGARRQFERAVELAREQGTLRAQSWATALMGLIHHYCGPRDEADALYARASDWLTRTNDRFMLIQTLMWRASLASSTGREDFALRLLREAGAQVSSIGGSLAIKVNRHLAGVLAREGRMGEVREIVEAARAQDVEGDPGAQADVLMTEAFSAFAAKDDEALRRCFSQALPILEAQGDEMELGEARMAYARLLDASGDRTGAGDQLERARELYVRIGATAAVEEIDAADARMRDLEFAPQNERETRSA